MVKRKNYYKVFETACSKFYENKAVVYYRNGKYTEYSYSELYGICQYFSQMFHLIPCHKSTIGLLMRHNPLIPSLIAAIEKNASSFMFLDPHNSSQQNLELMTKIKLNFIISIAQPEDYADYRDSLVKDAHPERTVEMFGFVIRLYKLNCSFNSDSGEPSWWMSTSGSTGESKLVRVGYECIAPNIEDFKRIFRVETKDVIYFSTPLTFDPAMVEIFLATTCGAALLIAPEDLDVTFPGGANGKYAVSIWQTTPSKFFQYTDSEITNKILSERSKLKVLALGGEPVGNVRRLKLLRHAANKTRIFCLYGVTELSCWACVSEVCLSKTKVPEDVGIGSCLSQTEIHYAPVNDGLYKIMLGSRTRKCSIIGSELSSISDSDSSTINWIDTGDLVEKKNGKVFFQGREDDVIKRFGRKINLHLIEKTALSLENVQQCCAIWLHTYNLLMLCYTSQEIADKALLAYLWKHLDKHHMPDRLVKMETLPLNKHGKISKRNVAKLLINDVSLQSENQKRLDEISFINELKSVVKFPIGVNQKQFLKTKSFFDLGGDSFSAFLLANKLEKFYACRNLKLLPYLLNPHQKIADYLNILSVSEITESRKKRKPSLDLVSVTKRSAPSPSMCDEKFDIIWHHDLGKCVDATPTIHQAIKNTYMTVGSHSGSIVVAEAVTGSLVGVMDLSARVEASVLCVYDRNSGRDLGIVGGYDGTVSCFDLNDCTEHWRINIGSMIKSKAAFVRGAVYIAAYDGIIRRLDVESGTILQLIAASVGGISADLTVLQDTYIIYGSLDGRCGCVECDTPALVWTADVASPVFAQPKLAGDARVLFAEVKGAVHCLNSLTGESIWIFDATKGHIFSSFSIIPFNDQWRVTFGCHDCNVYCLNVAETDDVALAWCTTLDSHVYATPCSMDSTVIVATTKGTLYMLDLDTGETIGCQKIPGEVFSSPQVYNTNVYLGCRDDNVYCVKIRDKSIKH